MEMGILQEAFMIEMRGQLSPQEYIRQLLCRNVTAQNVVWEKWVQWASQLGLTIGAQIEAPVPGGRYRRRGPIAFGYDHLGHGEDRSEEHTSELQSLMRISYAVFCLKKKNKQYHCKHNTKK